MPIYERRKEITAMTIPTMVTIRAAADQTGLSYDYIRKLCLAGKIVFVRSGSKYMINLEKLVDYLNNGETCNAQP